MRVFRSTRQRTRFTASGYEGLLVKYNTTVLEQRCFTERVHIFYVLTQQQANFAVRCVICLMLIFNAIMVLIYDCAIL